MFFFEMLLIKYLSIPVTILILIFGIYVEREFPQWLKNELTISPKARWYRDWQTVSIPVKMKFYFYNWTNVDQIYNATEKLKFNILGPYTFRESNRKVNITWTPDSVFYRQLKHWYFDAEDTCGHLNDSITNINVLLVTAMYAIRFQSFNYVSLFLISGFLNRDIYKTATVNELLFDGYEDPLLNFGKWASYLHLVDAPKQDKFGWFYNRNGTSEFEGIFEAKRFGGEIITWNKETNTKFFSNSCSEIRGSAGELWPINIKENYIEMFSPNLCKTIRLNKVPQTVIVKGIEGIMYEADKYLFDNGDYYPENRCYCLDECLPAGAINVSTCRYGSPSFASQPHFYNADPYYFNNIEGLSPNKTLHNTYIVLEPATGIALEVSARFQINIYIQSNSFLSKFIDVRNVVVPIVWFEQQAQISDKLAFNLRLLLFVNQWRTFILSTALVLSSFWLIYTVVNPLIVKIFTRSETINK